MKHVGVGSILWAAFVLFVIIWYMVPSSGDDQTAVQNANAASAPAESASSGVADDIANVAHPSGLQDGPCTNVDTMAQAPNVWVQQSPSAFSRRDTECDGNVLMAFAMNGVPHLVLASQDDPSSCESTNGSMHTFAINGQPTRFTNYCLQGYLISEPYSEAGQKRFAEAALSGGVMTLKLLYGSSIHFRLSGTRAVVATISEVAVRQMGQN
jgi:hypothetical protein